MDLVHCETSQESLLNHECFVSFLFFFLLGPYLLDSREVVNRAFVDISADTGTFSSKFGRLSRILPLKLCISLVLLMLHSGPLNQVGFATLLVEVYNVHRLLYIIKIVGEDVLLFTVRFGVQGRLIYLFCTLAIWQVRQIWMPRLLSLQSLGFSLSFHLPELFIFICRLLFILGEIG